MGAVGYTIVTYFFKIIWALVVWVLGRFIINFILKMLKKRIDAGKIDPSLSSFLKAIIKTLLYIVLVIMIISTLGIQTTSLVAILGAAGLAVGLALQGSLANFAGGVLILLFRPFSVGEFIEAGGNKGTVKEIHIFSTILDTPDNKRIIVPNGSLSNSTIINYSRNDMRRVDLVFSVSYDDDLDKAREVLRNIAMSQEAVIKEKDILVELGEYGGSSINFYYKVWCKKEDYWKVYFDSMKMVKKAFDEAGLSIPYPQMDVHLNKVEK
jgi:small conductance mechanosensitive channel